MMDFTYSDASPPLARKAWPGRWSTPCVGMLVLLAVRPAYSDNVVSGIVAAFEHVANIYLTLLVFNVVSWFIEAGILRYYLRLGYWKLFGLSALVNVVSTALGLEFWPLVFGQEGWKTAIALGLLDKLAALFLRSFVITIAEEALILVLALRRRVRAIVIAVVVANLLTYVLAAIIMFFVR